MSPVRRPSGFLCGALLVFVTLALTLALPRLGIAAAAPDAATVSAPSEQLLDRLSEQLSESVRGFDGVLGLALIDVKTGRQILINADQVFPTASTIKVALLAALCDEAAQAAPGGAPPILEASFTPRREDLIAGSPILGALVPTTTTTTTTQLPLSGRALATFMIVNSDNTATNLLIERYGMARMNQYLARLGLSNIRWRRKMMDLAAVRRGDENTATPRALSELFLKLSRGELRGHAEALRILGQPKLTFLGAELGEDVPLANKIGSLGGVVAETAVVRLAQRPFVLSVMTSFSGDARAAERLLAKLGLLAYRAFERLDGSSPLGRRL